MTPSKELIDELFLDKIRRARLQDPVEKFLDGARLFDMTCRIMRDGIRFRNLDYTDEQVERALFDQIATLRQLDMSA